MKRHISLVAALIGVTACSAPPNRVALSAVRDQGYALCRVKFPPKMGNYLNLALCEDPYFMAYADGMRVDYGIAHNLMAKKNSIAADVDQGKITDETAKLEWQAAAADANALSNQYDREARARRRSAALQALSTGFAQAAANMPTHTSCTSYGGISSVSTDCTTYHY